MNTFGKAKASLNRVLSNQLLVSHQKTVKVLLLQLLLPQSSQVALKLGLVAPFALLFFWAVTDFEALREAAITATTGDVQRWLSNSFLVVAPITLCVHKVLKTLLLERPAKATQTEAWFWSLPAGGDDLAIREMTERGMTPTASEHWEMMDLIGQLEKPENAQGSDFLDRKLLAKFGLIGSGLRPTQSESDALRMLRTRFGGAASVYEWDARLDSSGEGWIAFLAGREKKQGNAAGKPWHRSIIAKGQSPALSFTALLLRREALVYVQER